MYGVHVAGRILRTKVIGFELKVLMQLAVIVVIPFFFISPLISDLKIQISVLVISMFGAAALYKRTPPAQHPFPWLLSAIDKTLSSNKKYLDVPEHHNRYNASEESSEPSNIVIRGVKNMFAAIIKLFKVILGMDTGGNSGRDNVIEPKTPNTIDEIPIQRLRDDGTFVRKDGTTVALVEIEPRQWLTLSEDEKQNVYQAYMSFLNTLDFPIQLVTMTVDYDPSNYTKQLDEANIYERDKYRKD